MSAALALLFDGNCRFCTRSAKRLERQFGKERLRLENFQEDGVLARHPDLTYDACMKKMHVVDPEGRVYRGAGAVARIYRMTRGIGWVTFLYYVPVLRQLADLGYALIAKYRYKLFGKTQPCDPGGTCHLH